MNESAHGRAPAPSQYRDGANLRARQLLHERYGTDRGRWFRWVFDHLPLDRTTSVLELGAGPGRLWTDNLDRLPAGWRVVVSDASAGMVAEARAALGDRGAFEFMEVDAQDIPFGAGSFDVVIANHMLYHVPDAARAVREAGRVLRPQGSFLAATNGAQHMAELDELAGIAFPGHLAQLAVRDAETAGFTLENGGAILGGVFERVERFDAGSPLVVPDAEPLVAYLASVGGLQAALEDMRPAERERILAEATQRVRARIRRAGPVTITRASGLFVAR